RRRADRGLDRVRDVEGRPRSDEGRGRAGHGGRGERLHARADEPEEDRAEGQRSHARAQSDARYPPPPARSVSEETSGWLRARDGGRGHARERENEAEGPRPRRRQQSPEARIRIRLRSERRNARGFGRPGRGAWPSSEVRSREGDPVEGGASAEFLTMAVYSSQGLRIAG